MKKQESTKDVMETIMNEYFLFFNEKIKLEKGSGHQINIRVIFGRKEKRKADMVGNYRLEKHSKYLSTEQIHQLMDLLHPQYRDLGSNIKIYSNFFQFIKGIWKEEGTFFEKVEMFLVESDQYLMSGGYYLPFRNKVVVLEHLFFLFPENIRSLHAMYYLLHELRHNWQAKHNKFSSRDRSIPYHRRKEERDANLFAMRMMNKYKNEINDILTKTPEIPLPQAM